MIDYTIITKSRRTSTKKLLQIHSLLTNLRSINKGINEGLNLCNKVDNYITNYKTKFTPQMKNDEQYYFSVNTKKTYYFLDTEWQEINNYIVDLFRINKENNHYNFDFCPSFTSTLQEGINEFMGKPSFFMELLTLCNFTPQYLLTLFLQTLNIMHTKMTTNHKLLEQEFVVILGHAILESCCDILIDQFLSYVLSYKQQTNLSVLLDLFEKQEWCIKNPKRILPVVKRKITILLNKPCKNQTISVILTLLYHRLFTQAIEKPKLLLTKEYKLFFLSMLNKHTDLEETNYINDTIATTTIIKLLQKLKRKYCNKQYAYFTKYCGCLFLDIAIDKKLIIRQKTVSSGRYNPTQIKLTTNVLCVNLARDLPAIVRPDYTQSKVITKTTLHNYELLLKKDKPLIHNSQFLSGTFVNDHLLQQIEQTQTKCAINIDFLEAFLIQLKNPKEHRYLSNVLYHTNWDNLLSEAITKNEPVVLQYLEKLLTFSMDFNSFQIMPVPSDIKDHYSVVLTALTNKILNTKYQISVSLTAAIIMQSFNFFIYQQFFDARFRRYVFSALDYYIGFNRNLICFFNIVKLNYACREQQKKYKTTCLTLLKEQIIALSSHDFYNGLQFKHYDLSYLLKQNLKQKNIFSLYNLINDRVRLQNEQPPNSFYSLDATGSGGQIFALLQKSKKLATYTNLITSQNIQYYDTFLHQLQTELKSIQNFVEKLQDSQVMSIYESFDLSMKAFTLIKTTNKIFTMFKEKNSYFGFDKQDDLIFQFLNRGSTFYEEVKLRTKLTYNHWQLSIFCSLVKLIQINKILLTYKIPLTRKSIKHALMIVAYAGSARGRIGALVKALQHDALTNGWLHKNVWFDTAKILFSFVDKRMMLFLNSTLPELLNLKHAVFALAKNNALSNFTFKTKFINCHFECFKLGHNTMRIKQRVSQYTYITPMQNINAFSYGFIANFIQLCDAHLITIVFDLSLTQLYLPFKNSLLTIHDCFYTTPLLAPLLKPLLLDSYKIFLNENLVKLNFEDYPDLFNAMTCRDDILTSDDINHPDFVKH